MMGKTVVFPIQASLGSLVLISASVFLIDPFRASAVAYCYGNSLIVSGNYGVGGGTRAAKNFRLISIHPSIHQSINPSPIHRLAFFSALPGGPRAA
jgi:hypothetical protein